MNGEVFVYFSKNAICWFFFLERGRSKFVKANLKIKKESYFEVFVYFVKIHIPLIIYTSVKNMDVNFANM